MELLQRTLGAEAARLYESDPSQRMALLSEVSKRGWPSVLPCKGIGGIGMVVSAICLGFPGASEESEPLVVAAMFSRAVREQQILPLASEDKGMMLCAKTLVSLSIFMPAMLGRWKRRGTPKPGFYRTLSVGILRRGPTAAHRALGTHHQAWENFLHEQFAPRDNGILDIHDTECDTFA